MFTGGYMVAIQVKGLSKHYPGFKLDKVSFDVKEGSIVGFVGINGSGKTTTLKSILGLIHPDVGEISVSGMSIRDPENEMRVKEGLGVVLDNDYFFQKLTIREMTQIARTAYKSWDENDYRKFLQRFELPENRRIEDLSKGMKMKYALTIAFSHHAGTLILDEPTSGLDPFARDEFDTIIKDFIEKDSGHSVLFSSHITSDIEKTASEVVFIHKGKIIFQKSMSEIRRTGRTLDDIMLGEIKEGGHESLND